MRTKKVISLLLFSLTFACTEKIEEKTKSFSEWHQSENLPGGKFVVINFDGCSACSYRLVKIINEKNTIKSNYNFIIITKDLKQVSLLLEDLENKKNVHLIPLTSSNIRIVDSSPVLYFVNKERRYFREDLTIEQFDKLLDEIEILSLDGTLFFKSYEVKGNPIIGFENFLSISDSGLSYEEIYVY